jgi:hypothetical protein
VWKGRPEHAITTGDVESTNQNRIRLSTAVSLLSFMEERGGKRFIKQETAINKATAENTNEKGNG